MVGWDGGELAELRRWGWMVGFHEDPCSEDHSDIKIKRHHGIQSDHEKPVDDEETISNSPIRLCRISYTVHFTSPALHYHL